MKKILLGRVVPLPQRYDPSVLYPLQRQRNENVALIGADIWHLWELSWLNKQHIPQTHTGRLIVPAESPCMIESKSLKLYLFSLHGQIFSDEKDLCTQIQSDVGAVVGAPIEMSLSDFPIGHLPGECIDDLAVALSAQPADMSVLERQSGQMTEETLCTHLFRCQCPVTHQPDWASVVIHYIGEALCRHSLLAYLLSFRTCSIFQERCVEKIFTDLYTFFQPQQLTVKAYFLRRGGVDINPWRSLSSSPPLPERIGRQ